MPTLVLVPGGRPCDPPRNANAFTSRIILNASNADPAAAQDRSPWAPLRNPMFRAFWFASLVSNLGTWIHEVGAGWLMTNLDSSPEMVSAVRTAMAAPIVLLAIPAGVLADRIDRRKLLVVTQLILFATTATLASLTFADAITAWGLLGLTIVMGMGLVLHVPTWQAAIPEIVPKREMSRAVALGSISFNLARAAGPAVGGILIAMLGVWVAFAINALSFAGVIVVLLLWKRDAKESTRGLSFRLSLYQGVRFVGRNSSMRHVMLGVALFIVPGSALWSLLPLVAKQRLQWGADGFGLLVACVGIGAVVAAHQLTRLQSRFGSDRTVAGSMLLFALGLFVMSQSMVGAIVVAAAIVMGAGWMMTLTTLNATAQVTLPSRLRARGMSCYLTAMAVSMSTGSFLWGQVAGWTSLSTAQTIAAATIVVTAAISLRFHLGQSLT
ncbi:MAG: MFS transporter [Pirellulaceae bacterium]|nr:MFS transporter [Pirellulaceae bacterium]